jgi:hypothetical protein
MNGTNNAGPSFVPSSLPHKCYVESDFLCKCRPSNDGSSHPTSHAIRHLPLIIGASVGAVVLTLLVALFLFFIHRRRQNKRKSLLNHPITPSLPLQHENMREKGLQDRDSSHFLDVKLSPGGHIPRVPEMPIFPSVSRSESISSYSSNMSATPMIPKTHLDLPKLPPPIIPRFQSPQTQSGIGPTGATVRDLMHLCFRTCH